MKKEGKQIHSYWNWSTIKDKKKPFSDSAFPGTKRGNRFTQLDWFLTLLQVWGKPQTRRFNYATVTSVWRFNVIHGYLILRHNRLSGSVKSKKTLLQIRHVLFVLDTFRFTEQQEAIAYKSCCWIECFHLIEIVVLWQVVMVPTYVFDTGKNTHCRKFRISYVYWWICPISHFQFSVVERTGATRGPINSRNKLFV